jgi:hypothetical protein
MSTLNRQEQREVGRLLGEATTKLCEALAIAVKARERVVNGSPDITIQYQLRRAVKTIQEASENIRA